MFEHTKKLGFGLMRLPLTDPNDNKSIDEAAVCEMADAFLAEGFTYFDTAWMYCGFESENVARKALVERYPRDSFTLATKLNCGFFDTKAGRDEMFFEQLRKTGAGYFDYYLLHDIGEDHYKKYSELDCFTWMQEKKAQGLVRHIGFSYHDGAELLDRVLTEHPEMEFVQLQLNYLDGESEGVQARKCYEVATHHGKPVIVMEPVKGGTLAKLPAAAEAAFRAYAPEASIASWAIRFAASLDNVKVVLSGMSNMAQLRDNMGYMRDFRPLDAEEQRIVRAATDEINKSIEIPCTGCAYCTDGCPMNIAIPKYFSLYNADKQEAADKGWTPQGEYYDRLTHNFGKASDCIACGQCEGACPQHLPITRDLQKVAAHFGK